MPTAANGGQDSCTGQDCHLPKGTHTTPVCISPLASFVVGVYTLVINMDELRIFAESVLCLIHTK